MKIRNPFKSRVFRWPQRLWLRFPFWILMLAVLWKTGQFVFGLVIPWKPVPVAEVPFLDHAKTQVLGKIRVTASALGPHESYEV